MNWPAFWLSVSLPLTPKVQKWLPLMLLPRLVTSKSAGWLAQLSFAFGLVAGQTWSTSEEVPSVETFEPSVPDPIPAFAPSECRYTGSLVTPAAPPQAFQLPWISVRFSSTCKMSQAVLMGEVSNT